MSAQRSQLALLLLLPLAGCADILGPHAPENEAPLAVRLDSRVVEAYTGFGFELFRRQYAQTPGENVVLSPTSAAFALAMTYNGAATETKRAMARTLGVEGIPLDEFNRANRDWLGSLRTTGDGNVQLSLANSLWALQGFPFHGDFMDRNRAMYDASVTELPFDDAAVRAINAWASENTQGKIDHVLDQIPGDAVLYLLNALYFKGVWTNRFDGALTRDERFHRLDGSTVTVPMMRQTLTALHYRGDGFQLVSLPYGKGRFSMVLALPDPETSLGDIVAKLEPKEWNRQTSEMRLANLSVVLPRFRIEREDSLNRALADMGMAVAFSGKADFSAMSPAGGLFISMVKQNTYVEVNEEGTEAAAVTVVEVGRTSTGIPLLHFDRPFLFAIRDGATGTVLFLGTVVDPRA